MNFSISLNSAISIRKLLYKKISHMELEITLIIAAVMIAIYAICFTYLFIEIKKSPKLNPDEPFLKGDDGFNSTDEREKT